MTIKALYPTIRPSLLLDFAKSKSLDPRITFTRASGATRINADGTLELVGNNVPRISYDAASGKMGLLIEEQRTNLLTYSEQFDNAAWLKSNASVTPNMGIAPDGTLTADSLVKNAAYGYTSLQPLGATLTAHTGSVFVKAGTEIFAGFALSETFASTTLARGNINLLTGEVTTLTGAALTVEMLPGGWLRVWATVTYTNTNVRLIVYPGTVAGTETGNVLVWGAQLEAGAFPTSYTPSTETFTGRASGGTYINSAGHIATAASGVARYSHNPTNLTVAPKLLLEEQRTNLLTYSQEFDNANWTKARCAITANAATAPDGTLTADKFVEDVSVTATHYMGAASGIVTLTAAPHATSVYVKAGGRNRVRAYIVDSVGIVAGTSSIFDLSSGVVISGSQCGISAAGNGWYRIYVYGTTAAGAAASGLRVLLDNGSGDAYTGDGTSGLYIWGAQLEAGAFPTSYIPTTTAAATRAADTSTSSKSTRAADVALIDGVRFSSWYRQDEGTFVVECSSFSTEAQRYLFAVCTATETTRIDININSSNLINPRTVIAGAAKVSVSNGAYTSTNLAKTAYALKDVNFAASTNGASAVTASTAAAMPADLIQMIIGSLSGGYLNGHIFSFKYYPVRIPNAQLQALSAL